MPLFLWIWAGLAVVFLLYIMLYLRGDDMNNEWIPFRKRPLTKEEQQKHPDWCYILDCKLPDDDEDILVSNGKYIWIDRFNNNGTECYLESDACLDDCAWMTLPKPWNKKNEQID